ncbi:MULTISPECIES: hypothetical protein [Flavobacterium]|uniref:hypothetical protein n=1 Tax=Flavobacterium TaxID=237 RepID=UPI0021155889|nr:MULTISPECIES: hypothetical protein [Flavobacterium]UUF12425.1 hypothetical protein NLJ00_14310 [Flavobacterium panici]
MEKALRLQVRKELDARQQQEIIKLKGSLISKGYTEIIHILDKDDQFHINSFKTEGERIEEVQDFIKTFISSAGLADSVTVT